MANRVVELRRLLERGIVWMRDVKTGGWRWVELLLGWRLSSEDALDPLHDAKRIVMAGMVLICVTFGGGFLWAAFAPLAGAIVVQGTVKVESNRKIVQHLEGGLVKEILVHSGDHVEQGQPLVVLENVLAASTVEVLQLQLQGERAKLARLEAMRKRLDRVEFPDNLLEKQGDPRVAAIMQSEKSFFDAQRQVLLGQVSLLNTQISAVEEEIKGLSIQIKSANEGIAYLREDLKKNEVLYEKKYVAHSRILEFKRELSTKDERHGQYLTAIAEAKQRKAGLELRVINLYDDYAKGAAEEFKETTKRISEIDERLRPLINTLERQTIVAPATGIVMDVKIHTTGGVIASREPLMEIVPDDAELVVSGNIRPDNIDDISVGREVDLRLSAFKQRTTPMARGTVKYISADIITTDSSPVDRDPHYIVTIDVDMDSVASIGKGFFLMPGMPVTAYIKTANRTALDYLIEPVTDTLRSAFKEP